MTIVQPPPECLIWRKVERMLLANGIYNVAAGVFIVLLGGVITYTNDGDRRLCAEREKFLEVLLSACHCKTKAT